MNRRCIVDKVLSARVDESVLRRIGSLAQRLHTSKKRVIENAVQMYAENVDQEQGSDVFRETFGTWRRKESADEIVVEARRAFRESVTRRRA
jgi:hypothetical protein